MSRSPSSNHLPSRRHFIKTGLAVAGTCSVLPLEGWSSSVPRPYKRVSMTSSAGIQMLGSYKTAIKNLLALPPSDPRNWYRNAFIHTLDCPHGNWWLLPWHRAYIGWFEQTCREYSGNSEFAFPFWDWTATTAVPASFWTDVLYPDNSAYVASLQAFQSEFTNPMSALWSSFSAAQLSQLAARGYNSIADVWAQVIGDPMFYPAAQARGLTPSNPNFDIPTKAAVSSATVVAALQQTTFTGFGSSQATSHEQMVGYGILEGQPHNLVHNVVGGFMLDFLSPTDPLFYMHHSNLDRLWTIWTAKQAAAGLPTLPTGSALKLWNEEPFLFFRNSAGNPVTANIAGDYATVGSFNYSYGTGTNSTVPAAVARNSAVSLEAMSAAVSSGALDESFPATLGTAAFGTVAEVTLPPVVLQAVVDGLSLLTQVSVQGAPHSHGSTLDVFLNPDPDSSLLPDSPGYIASLQFVGVHHHSGSVIFTIPLTASLDQATKVALAASGQPLTFYIVPTREDQMQSMNPTVTALAVTTS